MRYLMALLVPLVLLAVYNARADGNGSTSSKPDIPGRFEMERTEDGYVRLDTQTGAISLCHRKYSGWACEAVPDDRIALEDEIHRLDTENKFLRDQVGQLVETGDGEKPGAEEDRNRIVIELPTKEDVLESVDQAGEFLDEVMNRFQIMLESMKKDFDNQT